MNIPVMERMIELLTNVVEANAVILDCEAKLDAAKKVAGSSAKELYEIDEIEKLPLNTISAALSNKSACNTLIAELKKEIEIREIGRVNERKAYRGNF